jgi:type I restriction enzyme S subunit
MGYETYRIADLIDEIAMGPFGSNIKVSCFVDSGVPVLNGSNLEGFSLSEKTFRYVTRKKADSLNKANAHRGDIVITHRGTLGQIVFIPQDSKYDRYVISQSQFRVRCNDKVLPEYLVYYFHTPIGQHKLLSNASQVGVPALARPSSTFQQIEVVLPELSIQKCVVEIISTIQKKIANNQELNDNLQQQAFSVFDNLIANAENNDYTVSDYAFLNPKRTLAKNQVARSIDMSQLSTSGAFPSGWEMKPFNGGMRFTNGDTLLARITPCLENGKTAFIDFLDDGEVAFGSTEYIVLAPKNDTPPEMLYCLARYPAFVDYAVKNMNGSSGRQRVSAETVGQYRLPLFDKHSLVLFKEVVSPMFLKMRYNSLENMRLAELRDALLPKLMSGEIDVSAVQL